MEESTFQGYFMKTLLQVSDGVDGNESRVLLIPVCIIGRI
jgi:hypothetical protein